MNVIKKRQHFVPKTYLKPFSNIGRHNDMVWAYFLEQRKTRLVAIDHVCVENYLYEHYICHDDGKTEFVSPNSIENGYMKFENEYRFILEKIINPQNGLISLTVEERNIIANFMVSILFRHPIFVNVTNALHERFYEEHQEWKDQFTEIEDNYLKMSYLHTMLEMHQDPNQSRIIQAMKNTLDKDQLCVFKADTGEFVTSDVPVVNIYGDVNGVAYDLVGMPVSPQYFVAFIDINKNVSDKVYVIKEKQIMFLNRRQYGHSATSIVMSKSEVELKKQVDELSK